MPSLISDIDVRRLRLNITLCYRNYAILWLPMYVMIRYVLSMFAKCSVTSSMRYFTEGTGSLKDSLRYMNGSAACSQRGRNHQVMGLINMGEMAVMKIIFPASPRDHWSAELLLTSVWACEAIPNMWHSLYESSTSVTVSWASLSGDESPQSVLSLHRRTRLS